MRPNLGVQSSDLDDASYYFFPRGVPLGLPGSSFPKLASPGPAAVDTCIRLGVRVCASLKSSDRKGWSTVGRQETLANAPACWPGPRWWRTVQAMPDETAVQTAQLRKHWQREADYALGVALRRRAPFRPPGSHRVGREPRRLGARPVLPEMGDKSCLDPGHPVPA